MAVGTTAKPLFRTIPMTGLRGIWPVRIDDIPRSFMYLGLITDAEEHHIGNFDAGAFFQLHDFDESGGWTPDEVRRFYGLNDESNANVSAEKKEEVTRVVYRDFDRDHNGVIERSEWIEAIASGLRLPDFGVSA